MHSATCVFRWTEADTMHLYRNTFIFYCSGDKAAKYSIGNSFSAEWEIVLANQ